MDDIWSILGLEATRDVSAIRRAYAQKARACHPEEDPEGFMKLREAYQAALDWAEGQDAPVPQVNASRKTGGNNGEGDEGSGAPDEELEEKPEALGWFLPDEEPEEGPNPFADSEAIRQFETLYLGDQRKNANVWMDYFTSETFLDAAREPQFTRLMWEKVTEAERTLPPTKEFLLWLSIAYQYSADPLQGFTRWEYRSERLDLSLQVGVGADFDGLDSILGIAVKGAPPKPLRGNDFAVAKSFEDYDHLVVLARAGAWNQQAMTEFEQIVRRYHSAYIKERCEQSSRFDLERHPAGLRVFTHFFARYEVPEEVYRRLWQELGLKMAIMGRSKILYGRLREIVVERVPNIDGEKPENFLELNRALDAYLARIKECPEREEEESAAFFAREDLQKALHGRRFVEKELLTYTKWRREEIGEGLVRRILDFYQAHPEIPGAGGVTAGMGRDLLWRVAKRQSQEDAQAEVPPYYVHLTLAYRPFFRHWLNTAGFNGVDPENGASLSEYLRRHLPWQREWSRRFLQKEDGTIQPRTVSVCMGEVEVDLYLRHMEFRVKGKPVHRPCLLWEQTMIESGEWFLYLLPITVAPCSWFSEVERTIYRHLAVTAAPEEDRAVLAGCLAGHVCCLPEDEYTGEPARPEEVLPMTLWAEDGEQLYGCVWMEGGRTLVLFEQVDDFRQERRRYELAPGEDALETARRLLEQAVSPEHYSLNLLRELPLNVYVLPNDGPEYVLKQEGVRETEAEMGLHWPEADRGELVTLKAIEALIGQFAKDEIQRLELSWYEGKLVFRRQPAGYACFYFEGSMNHDIWYSMLSKPEVYRVVESDDVVYVPFGMGTLPDYVVHDSPASILRNLDRVFMQIAPGRPQAQGAGGWLWDSNVNRMNGQHKRYMAQQKVGGFPPHRGRNRLAARFVMSKYPVELEQVELDGKRTVTAIKSGSYGRAADALTQFMKGKLAKLRLSWEFLRVDREIAPDGGVFRRHLVLLQDDGRSMMAWLQDDKDWAQYYVAETEEAEEAVETFLDREVPARLVHHDLKRIRNGVDLILDDMSNTDPVTERPGEFETVEGPYETVRAELIGQEE